MPWLGSFASRNLILHVFTCVDSVRCLQAGSHTPLQHIHAEYAEIRGRNEAQQARVEDILSQRLALEQRTKQVGHQGTILLLSFSGR